MRKLTAALLLLSTPVLARFRPPELVDVPIATLYARFSERTRSHPKDAHAWYVLGRVDAMAYASPNPTTGVVKATGEPMLGMMGDDGHPASASGGQTRRKDLDAAIAAYKTSVRLDGSFEPARLGLGWCLREAGRKADAIVELRKVYQTELKLQGTARGPGVDLASEAADYLLQLLDPTKDSDEISRIRVEKKRLDSRPRIMTPILLPLGDEQRIEQLVDPAPHVRFDLDGSGRQSRWGWITPRAGWLVYVDHRDRVDSGIQMFGSATFNIVWQDGYQALSAFDRDGDGWLRGDELAHLAVWCDANEDGVCQSDELRSLSDLGIVGLCTRAVTHRNGFPYSPEGVEYRDGRRGPSFDWISKSL